MSLPNPSTAMAEVIVDELARNQVELVVVSPGSRSAALAIAASRHPRLDTLVAIDERSAAFLALGRAKACGRPAAVVSTSGTAPANWYPAVIEADMSNTPLVLMSADRPTELRGVGANQTIDQVEMFGARVRVFADVPAPGGDDSQQEWRTLVCRLLAAARGDTGLPGPVHLNLGFREPTLPVSDDGRSQGAPFAHSVEGRPGSEPWERPRGPAPEVAVPRLPRTSRGLVVAGEGSYDGDRLRTATVRLGWPLLATALSGLRGGGAVDSYHHLLAGGVPRSLRPELVVAVGRIGPSDRLEMLLDKAVHRVRVHPPGRPIDPGRNATLLFDGDPAALLDTLDPVQVDRDWAESWQRTAAAVRAAMVERLDASSVASGAGIAHELSRVDWGCLVVGSSLPIREVDAHLTRTGHVVANRGASGVDGFVSTALGVSTAVAGTVGLTGDLGLLHDSNGYLSEEISDLVMVVVDNGGGGLFDSLPTARHAPFFERLFITPHRRRIADLAHFHRIRHSLVTEPGRLDGVVSEEMSAGGRVLVEVPVDRATDLETRQRLDEIGRSAVETAEA